MNPYVLQPPRYYRDKVSNMSHRLYRASWGQYREWLKSSIDDPHDDDDVVSWLEQIAREKVNNPHSTFYIRG